jgi:glycerophosphoryl diester phosphodiesterase
MSRLPASFLTRPIAHRGFHELAAGIPENSIAAFEAAIEAGYGIELDVQRALDDVAMVFHDYDLDRLTGETGPIAQRTAAALGAIPLTGGQGTIPTLAQVLDLVAGRVTLLIEIKDQDGALGPNIGPLEQAVADVLRNYAGDAAVMSFNPHCIAKMADLLPDMPRGLVTCDFSKDDWNTVPESTLDHLRDIPDFDATGSSFISHDRADLTRSRVHDLKAQGANILCWTVRDPQQEAEARKTAQTITFEGYTP